MGRSINKDDVL